MYTLPTFLPAPAHVTIAHQQAQGDGNGPADQTGLQVGAELAALLADAIGGKATDLLPLTPPAATSSTVTRPYQAGFFAGPDGAVYQVARLNGDGEAECAILGPRTVGQAEEFARRARAGEPYPCHDFERHAHGIPGDYVFHDLAT